MVQYKILPTYEGYRVGDDASVWSRWRIGSSGEMGDEWRIMHPYASKGTNWYFIVTFRVSRGKFVTRSLHQIVLETFVGPKPKGKVARHLDGNKANNKLENLVWGTYDDNNGKDRIKHGTHLEGESCSWSKLTEENVREIRKLYATGTWKQTELADKYGVQQSIVWQIIHRKSWKHVK